MSLVEKLTAPKGGTTQGLPCSVATLLHDLPTEEAAALRAMLDAPWRIWGHSDIERALREESQFVGVGSVGKHRRHTCRCTQAGE